MIRGRQRMLLVVTLIVGLLGMHALVLAGASVAVTGSHTGAPVLVAATSAVVHSAVGHDVVGPAAATEVAYLDHGGGHGSTPSVLHHVVHMCLAILAALVVAGAVVLVLWCTLRPDRADTPIGARVRRSPGRRPRPNSVRLAQLCVLRN